MFLLLYIAMYAASYVYEMPTVIVERYVVGCVVDVVINHIVTLHERDFYVEDYDHGRHEEVVDNHVISDPSANDNDVIACGKLLM